MYIYTYISNEGSTITNHPHAYFYLILATCSGCTCIYLGVEFVYDHLIILIAIPFQ